jgi:hypothetical protein
MTSQVSGLKRPAEFQLTKEVDQVLHEENQLVDGNNSIGLSGSNGNNDHADDSKDVIENRK